MSASKFRIPRLAVAALVLGACGEDSNDSKGGVDVSEPRVRNLAAAACKQYAECDPEYFSESYDGQADCVASYEDDFDDLAKTYGKACMDAYLDWMDCYVDLSCDDREDDNKCVAQYAKLEKFCEGIGEHDDDEEEDKSSAKNAGRFPGRRIPR